LTSECCQYHPGTAYADRDSGLYYSSRCL